MRFHTPGEEIGCSARRLRANRTLKRQKSISSHAESISAWIAVFDWPSIVAALSVCRHGPASRSAARRRIAARSSNDIARHAGAASRAARRASCVSCWVAPASVPRTERWLCGWTTSNRSPPPMRWSPPMVIVSSSGSFCSSASLACSSARSGVPGAYCRTGSLTGAGTWVTASTRQLLFEYWGAHTVSPRDLGSVVQLAKIHQVRCTIEQC